jgi:hypothetical protein
LEGSATHEDFEKYVKKFRDTEVVEWGETKSTFAKDYSDKKEGRPRILAACVAALELLNENPSAYEQVFGVRVAEEHSMGGSTTIITLVNGRISVFGNPALGDDVYLPENNSGLEQYQNSKSRAFVTDARKAWFLAEAEKMIVYVLKLLWKHIHSSRQKSTVLECEDADGLKSLAVVVALLEINADWCPLAFGADGTLVWREEGSSSQDSLLLKVKNKSAGYFQKFFKSKQMEKAGPVKNAELTEDELKRTTSLLHSDKDAEGFCFISLFRLAELVGNNQTFPGSNAKERLLNFLGSQLLIVGDYIESYQGMVGC